MAQDQLFPVAISRYAATQALPRLRDPLPGGITTPAASSPESGLSGPGNAYRWDKRSLASPYHIRAYQRQMELAEQAPPEQKINLFV